mmetsp:Transcript_69306/g.122686  ORF Transcript_69306/g.122686 Transcript_69306/m.122686 type:complete len:210 (+) Transcript_69306:2120-2749(+)
MRAASEASLAVALKRPTAGPNLFFMKPLSKMPLTSASFCSSPSLALRSSFFLSYSSRTSAGSSSSGGGKKGSGSSPARCRDAAHFPGSTETISMTVSYASHQTSDLSKGRFFAALQALSRLRMTSIFSAGFSSPGCVPGSVASCSSSLVTDGTPRDSSGGSGSAADGGRAFGTGRLPRAPGGTTAAMAASTSMDFEPAFIDEGGIIICT